MLFPAGLGEDQEPRVLALRTRAGIGDQRAPRAAVRLGRALRGAHAVDAFPKTGARSGETLLRA
jgi:hypothetical protein